MVIFDKNRHFREASYIYDKFKGLDLSIEIGKVSYWDYIINESITIERKTAKDFLISIVDGRLFRQLPNLKKFCPNPILLIEGNPYKTELDFESNAIKGALISAQTVWYIPTVFSQNKKDTKDVLLMIGKQDETVLDVVPLRGGYRPKRLKSKQLYLLQGLPKVGPMLAKKLLLHFKSVSRIMNATIEELIEVDGIGRISAVKIRDVLDKEYV